jgi:hypothetical protein
MQLYTLIFLSICAVVAGAVVVKIIEYKQKTASLIAKNGTLSSQKDSKTHFQDQLQYLDVALSNAVNTYNQQMALCAKRGLTEEEAKALNKPLKDKIELLDNIKKLDDFGLAKPAAQIADTFKSKILDALKDM